MKVLGYIVVIKRTGGDHTSFPLSKNCCTLGRSQECDIRVQLPSVSKLHCKVDVDISGKAFVTNLSQQKTYLNKSKLKEGEIRVLCHKDIITVDERHFRWEYPEGSILTISPLAENILTITKSRRSYGQASLFLADAKKVSFGPYLSPEQFDKKLPPATPIRKGEKPMDDDVVITPGNTSKKGSSINSAELESTKRKSLLKRRSPTPLKPYLARTLRLSPAESKASSPKSRSLGRRASQSKTIRKSLDKKISSSSKLSTSVSRKRKASTSPEKAPKRLKASTPGTKSTPNIQQSPRTLKGTAIKSSRNPKHSHQMQNTQTSKKTTPKSTTKSVNKNISSSSKRAKSWADVVKYGTKRSSKSQRALINLKKLSSKKRGRPTKKETPKGYLKLQKAIPQSFNFGIKSTGHANSPAPIIINNKSVKTPKRYRKGVKSSLIISDGKAMPSPDLSGLKNLVYSPKDALSKSSQSLKEKAVLKVFKKMSSRSTGESNTKASITTFQKNEVILSTEMKSLLNKNSVAQTKLRKGTQSLSLSPRKSTLQLSEQFITRSKTDINEDQHKMLIPKSPRKRKISEGFTPTNTKSPKSPGRPKVSIPKVLKTLDKPKISEGITPLSTKSPKSPGRPKRVTPKVAKSSDEPKISKELTPTNAKSPKSPGRSKEIVPKVAGSSDNSKALSPTKVKSQKSPITPKVRTPRSPGRPKLLTQKSFDRSIVLSPKSTSKPKTLTPKASKSPDKLTQTGPYCTKSPSSSLKKRITIKKRKAVSLGKYDSQFHEKNSSNLSPNAELQSLPYDLSAISTPGRYFKVAKVSRKSSTSMNQTDSDDAEKDITSFDFTNVATPNISKDLFISPLTSETISSSHKKRVFDNNCNIASSTPFIAHYKEKAFECIKASRSTRKCPLSDYSNVSGIKKLMSTTPKADYTNVAGIKRLMRNSSKKSPNVDYSNVDASKKLVSTPKPPNQEPLADYSDVAGLKKLMHTPPEILNGITLADYTDVDGIRRLMTTPKDRKSISNAHYSDNLRGVRKLLRTPKSNSVKSPSKLQFISDDSQLIGLRTLFKSSKSKGFDDSAIESLSQLMASPSSGSIIQVLTERSKSSAKKQPKSPASHVAPSSLKQMRTRATKPIEIASPSKTGKRMQASPLKTSETLTKKRGRPKKNLENIQKCSPPKRKTRAKKVALSPDKSQSSPVRRTTRGKKEASKAKSSPKVPSGQTPKGRKRKPSVAEPTEIETPAKKRGRPKKNLQDTQKCEAIPKPISKKVPITDEKQTTEIEIPKKRGRPKKNLLDVQKSPSKRTRRGKKEESPKAKSSPSPKRVTTRSRKKVLSPAASKSPPKRSRGKKS